MNRFVLNETSYHGKGAINAIPDEVKGMHLTYQGSQYFSDVFKKTEGDMYVQIGSRIEDVCPDDLKRDTVAIHKGYISVTPLLSSRTNMDLFK